MTQFGMYSQTTPRNDASPGARPVEPRRRLPLHLRSVRRLSLRQDERHQRPGRHLHVVRRPLELLQLRQLDLPAVVRLVEHAVVLQRHARPDLPERQAEDRAVARQRLAVVRQVQQAPGLGGQILWRPNGFAVGLLNNYWGTDTLGNPGPQARPHRRQHPGEVLRPARRRRQQGGVHVHVRRGLRIRRRRRSARGGTGGRRRRSTSSASWPTTACGSTRTGSRSRVGGGAINNPGRYLVLHPADQRRHGALGHAVLHRRTPAIRTRRGTCRRRSTTCRASSSRSGSSSTTAPPTCRTSRGAGGVTPPGGNVGAPGSTS